MSASAKLREKLAAQQLGTGQTAEVHEHSKARQGGKGIPDAVVDKTAGMVGEAAKETSAGALASTVERFNADHFVSIEGGKTAVYRETFDYELNRPKLDRMSIEAYRALYSHETIGIPAGDDGNTRKTSVADAWLKNPKRRTFHNGVALLPDGNAPAGVYNLWRGFGCEPKRGAVLADVKPALVHLLRVVCGDDRVAFDYFIGWLASGVQNPGAQAEVAIVLQGGRGTGKGTIGRWFRDLYGMHGMHIQHPRHLTGNFNAHLQTCLAMFVDEAFFVGDKAGNGVLKSLITEDQITIEKKGVDVASVRNRLKIIMSTNEDHAVIAGTDERRYFILQVANIKAQDHQYFGKLNRWWDNGGRAALLGYLLDYDLTGFNIRKVPNTAALERQKIESLDVFNKWLFEKLSDGRWEQDRTPEQWAGDFKAFADELGRARYANTSVNSVGMRLRMAGIEVEKVRQPSGDRRNIWRVTPLAGARSIFAEKLGLTHQRWDEGESDV